MAIDFSVEIRVKPGHASWREQSEIGGHLTFLPHVGDVLIVDHATKGIGHKVLRIEHRIGAGEQRVTLWCDEIEV